jgi:hypothetical protein
LQPSCSPRFVPIWVLRAAFSDFALRAKQSEPLAFFDFSVRFEWAVKIHAGGIHMTPMNPVHQSLRVSAEEILRPLEPKKLPLARLRHDDDSLGPDYFAELSLLTREELIARHGIAHGMPSLLQHLAASNCPKKNNSQWDRCGVHYVEPIETSDDAAKADD